MRQKQVKGEVRRGVKYFAQAPSCIMRRLKQGQQINFD